MSQRKKKYSSGEIFNHFQPVEQILINPIPFPFELSRLCQPCVSLNSERTASRVLFYQAKLNKVT